MKLSIKSDPVPLKVDADGAVRVGQSSVLLDTVITAFKLGESAEEIADNFSTLDLADVYAVIGYYLRRPAEIDAYLEQRHQQGQALREQIETLFPPHELRKRLLARRNTPSPARS
jgi:uncharacterized protein (DUF433 family)